MTRNQNQIEKPVLVRVGLIGASIALILISLLIFGVNTRPEWGEYWRIRPLVITPLSAGLGAVLGYLVFRLAPNFGLPKAIGLIIGFIGFVISLWLGSVLGLAGTLWN